MLYLALAMVLGGVLVWLGRRRRLGPGLDVRPAALVVACVASIGAFATALKGAWLAALLLGAVAAWLWARLSMRRRKPDAAPLSPMSMSDQKARALLGVRVDATAEEIQAAYLRLIRTVHPDRGGTSGLAAELNAARDRLLGR